MSIARLIRFRDRATAGEALAPRVLEVTSPPSVVLGVPSGGVAVARPIAHRLGAPLCAVWVRKLIAPREPEVVLGAVDLDGDVTLSAETVRAAGLGEDDVAEVAFHAHQRLLEDWERTPGLDATSVVVGAAAIIVDDALGTGLTLRAAARWARRQGARRVVLAVPVVDSRIWAHLAAEADRQVALEVRSGVVVRSDVYEEYRRLAPADVARLLGA